MPYRSDWSALGSDPIKFTVQWVYKRSLKEQDTIVIPIFVSFHVARTQKVSDLVGGRLGSLVNEVAGS